MDNVTAKNAFATGFSVGAVAAAAVAASVFVPTAIFLQSSRADIGIKFEDGAAAVVQRDRGVLKKKSLMQELETAVDNYLNGRDSVVRVKLPSRVSAPGQ